MTYLIDTNLLTRSFQPASPQFPVVRGALVELQRRQERPCVVPQVLYEFWTVCTRPAGENGLGLSVAEAQAEQAKILSLFPLLPDSPLIFHEWQRLVVAYDVKGKNAHDTRLVAAMLAHGIRHILTFNGSDFARYAPRIEVVAPMSLLPSP